MVKTSLRIRVTAQLIEAQRWRGHGVPWPTMHCDDKHDGALDAAG